jgi:endonuclease/exonuclease/phosphatase family metal-dependent hydrolase
VCYRPASQTFDYDINARLLDVLTELRDERVLIMGDLNYPGVDWRGDCRGVSPESVMFAE